MQRGQKFALRASTDHYLASPDFQFPFGVKFDGARINSMFFLKYPCRQDISAIIIVNRDNRLDYDRSRIYALIDKMDGATGKFNPVFQCLLLHMRPRKSGEKSGMNIEDFHGEGA